MPALNIPPVAFELATVNPALLSRQDRMHHRVRVASFLGELWTTLAACTVVAVCGIMGTAFILLNWKSLVVGSGEIPIGDAGSVPAGALMSYALVFALPLVSFGCGFIARRTWFVIRAWESGQIKKWAEDPTALADLPSSLIGFVPWIDFGTGAVLTGVGSYGFWSLTVARSGLAIIPGLFAVVGVLFFRRSWLEWRQWQVHLDGFEAEG
jgi:hypothetical protein